jgi:dihydroorotase
MYAEAFEAAGALDRLEGFASLHGPDFYRLPRNDSRITLQRQTWQMPDAFDYGCGASLTPLRAGQSLPWKLQPGT